MCPGVKIYHDCVAKALGLSVLAGVVEDGRNGGVVDDLGDGVAVGNHHQIHDLPQLSPGRNRLILHYLLAVRADQLVVDDDVDLVRGGVRHRRRPAQNRQRRHQHSFEGGHN